MVPAVSHLAAQGLHRPLVCDTAVPMPRRRLLTLKTVLLAATAAAALIGAAMIAVPSAEEGARVCLGLSKCLSF
jgi:hypothetical protein